MSEAQALRVRVTIALAIVYLLWGSSHLATKVIAMQYVQSNTAALLNSTPALWIAWLGSLGFRGSSLTRTMRVGLLIAAWAFGESFDLHWTPRGLAAFLWLTLMSSCVACSAYSWLAVNSTPVVTGSYGYVNPAVAALLGWMVLKEQLSWIQISGMVVILVGMALVTGYWRPLPRRTSPAEPRAEAT